MPPFKKTPVAGLLSGLMAGLLAQTALATCVISSPVVTGATSYSYTQDAVQSVDVRLACTPADQPVLTFSAAGGIFDSASNRYTGTLAASNGDRLKYYIPGAYNSTLSPAQPSFRFQVIFPQGQWNASSSAYAGLLSIIVTF